MPVEAKEKLRDFNQLCSKKFFLKTFFSEEGKVVAACDADILGKKFQENEKILHVKQDFYFDRRVGIDEVLEELKQFFTANFVGKMIIEELVSRGIISKDNVKFVNGVPHIQIFMI
jgi:hypothetical protein